MKRDIKDRKREEGQREREKETQEIRERERERETKGQEQKSNMRVARPPELPPTITHGHDCGNKHEQNSLLEPIQAGCPATPSA